MVVSSFLSFWRLFSLVFFYPSSLRSNWAFTIEFNWTQKNFKWHNHLRFKVRHDMTILFVHFILLRCTFNLLKPCDQLRTMNTAFSPCTKPIQVRHNQNSSKTSYFSKKKFIGNFSYKGSLHLVHIMQECWILERVLDCFFCFLCTFSPLLPPTSSK